MQRFYVRSESRLDDDDIPALIQFSSAFGSPSVTTYLLDLVLFDFLLPESGIHYLSAFENLTRFLLLDAI